MQHWHNIGATARQQRHRLELRAMQLQHCWLMTRAHMHLSSLFPIRHAYFHEACAVEIRDSPEYTRSAPHKTYTIVMTVRSGLQSFASKGDFERSLNSDPQSNKHCLSWAIHRPNCVQGTTGRIVCKVPLAELCARYHWPRQEGIGAPPPKSLRRCHHLCPPVTSHRLSTHHQASAPTFSSRRSGTKIIQESYRGESPQMPCWVWMVRRALWLAHRKLVRNMNHIETQTYIHTTEIDRSLGICAHIYARTGLWTHVHSWLNSAGGVSGMWNRESVDWALWDQRTNTCVCIQYAHGCRALELAAEESLPGKKNMTDHMRFLSTHMHVLSTGGRAFCSWLLTRTCTTFATSW
jgi:hypothetical protein